MWYPSVTTVTGFSSREFFAEWSKDPENHKKSQYAASRGTKLHSYIEKRLLNEPVDFSDDTTSAPLLYEDIVPYLHKINNIRAQETTLWSPTIRIAGRLDLLSDYAGIPSVVDFKSSTKWKAEEYIQNYFEQCTIYSIMWTQLIKQPIKQIVVLIATENSGVQEFVRNPVDYVPKVYRTLKNFWKHHNFERIQETLNALTTHHNRE
jgi:hypothetical protein